MQIRGGSVLVLHSFDVGDEILIERIERVAGTTPTASSLAFRRTTPPYVKFRKAPLITELGELAFDLGGEQLTARARAKIYDFGVIEIAFRLPLSGTLQELPAFAARVVENPRLQQLARQQVERVIGDIQLCITPSSPELGGGRELEWEDYSVFVVEGLEGNLSGQELLTAHQQDLARVLRSDSVPLSDAELAEATRQPLSYYRDELLVVDWNAAFIYGGHDNQDVFHVLEYAVAMLLELRVYDGLLDRVLDRAYEDLEKKKSFLRSLSLRPLASTIDYLAEVKLEVSELIEKVTNSLKLVGDPYLARVYTNAAQRFHLSTWEASVREKLGTVEGLYSLLHEQTQSRLMIILELMIVILCGTDILFVALEFFTRGR